jgi:general L-amino acid transport system permease protein
MWYLFLTQTLPDSWEPWQVGNFFLSKGGINFPAPLWEFGHLLGLFGLLLAGVGIFVYRRWATRRFEATGQPVSSFWVPVCMLLAGALLGWFIGGAPSEFDTPVKGDFAIEFGAAVTPEFLTVLFGLTFYTAAFVAEVVRAGIQSVSAGQSEAAAALGLPKRLTMKLVMLPQALRVIIPPLTNQYLNLTKNSSLAVAVGYPDIVSVTNTALNQTGRAVECIAIVMLIYLMTSLLTSLLMNWYNKRAAIKER